MSEQIKMTLTEALRKIKSLDEQIAGFFNVERAMISYVIGSREQTPYAGMNKADLEKRIQSDHDKLDALIQNRTSIKRALILANATIMVEVAGKEYTIAEALELKKLVSVKEVIRRTMQKQLANLEAKVASNTEDVNKHINNLAQAAAGKEASDTDLKKASDQFIETVNGQYKITVVDPMKLREKIEALDKEILDIKNELDYRLSETNATNTLEVTLM